MATAKPKINRGDFSGLKEKGVSARTIETVKNSIALGARFNSRADLIKAGIAIDEADLIAANSSLSTAPAAKPVTVAIQVLPAGLFGYFLGIRRDVTDVGAEETLLPVSATGELTYTFDESVTGPQFTVFGKAPSGDFVELSLNNVKATHHTVARDDLGDAPFTITPVAEITNAKEAAAIAAPLLPPSRLKGRLIAADPSVDVEKIQIVIEVALEDDPEDSDFFPVCFAESESRGYFITSQVVFPSADDYKNLTAARAKIATTPAAILPIRLEPAGDEGGALPERLILYFEGRAAPSADGEKPDDCECGDCTELNFHEKKVLDEFAYFTVVRTTEPLIEAYEIDDVDEIDLEDLLDDVTDPTVKGALAGIKVPRATMVSFLTKHNTINKANVNSLLETVEADRLRRRVMNIPKPRAGRVRLNGANEIDWDERPTVYQAISIAHGHLLHFKQEWFNDGYSIGDLLYSLPLAPGQKKQIVVFDWDRKESAANVQQLDYQESLYNSLSRDRDVNEVARATLSETIRGSSEASSWGVGGGLGLGAIIPTPVPIGALLGVGGGYGSGSSSARQSANRTTTASSMQSISDRTIQSASAVRSQRSTVIQTVSQGERFQVSAEVIANYNHCHAMTVQYFEVLRHFEVRTRLADVSECLFIPLKMSPFTLKKALRWRDILQRTLRKRQLRPGFEAIYRIQEERESSSENYYDSIGLPKVRFAEEELEYIEGELYVEFQLTRPRNDDLDAFVVGNWNMWVPFLGDPLEFYNRFIKHETRKDDAFARHAGPAIAQAIFDEMRFYAVNNGTSTVSRQLPIDATLLSDFRNRTRLNVSLRMSGAITGVKREDIDFVRISLDAGTANNPLLRDLVNDKSLRIIVHSGSMRYRTRNLHEFLFQSSNIKNDLTLEGDDVRIFCPLSAKALRMPRLEDVELSNDLLHHLNENLEYYHQCIWAFMDEQRRFILLDGVMAPGRANGRSVASVVENKLIGIVGNCLVMPVAPGFKLDPILDETVDLFEHYYEDPRDPMRLSLPTKGVFAEAVMGRCNSCEKKDETRFWRWEESPIPDSPTTINAITTPVPQVTQPNLAGRDFPAPIINLQNAPALPDPQGYAALVTLLSNPNLFRDITGLTENQKNALAALQSSLQTAQKFGEGAQALTGQAAELFKFNKLGEMLGKGQITKEEFKEMVTKGQESQDVSKLKDIKKAVDKKELDEETGGRLKDATLKKIESEAETKSPAQSAFEALEGAEEGSVEVSEDGDKVSVTKGPAGPVGAPTQISKEKLEGLTNLDKVGGSLFERIMQNRNDRTYELLGSNTGIEDIYLKFTMPVIAFDSDDGTETQQDIAINKTLAPKANEVVLGRTTFRNAVTKHQELRHGAFSTQFFIGKPNAAIAPANTLFSFPFPLSVEFECGQPPQGATGSSGNTTHVTSSPISRYAVDFTMPMGTEVFAMRSGVVVEIEEGHPDLPITAGMSDPAPTEADKQKSNFVRVRHSDGTVAFYGHLQKDSVAVAVGDEVTEGTTKLGLSGNSGFSTGPHLHVSVTHMQHDVAANTTSIVSLKFKFRNTNGTGVTPRLGGKYKRT